MSVTIDGNTGVSLVQDGVITDANLPAGSVLQVVSNIKADTFSTTSTTYTDITGLSVSITPSSASNKILIIAYVSHTHNDISNSTTHIRLAGGNSDGFVGTTAGSRTRAAGGLTMGSTLDNGINSQSSDTIVFLDSPATTSATTYTVQIRNNGGATSFVNSSSSDTDIDFYMRTASSITVMEIAG